MISANKFLFLFIIFFVLSINSFSKTKNKNEVWAPQEGLELIGTKAPPLGGLKWLNSEPLSIQGLKGEVVLIRFWLVGCPFCTNSAPSLVGFNNKYKDKGLVVLGIHHPKSIRTQDPNLVKRQAEVFGFDFPIAQDNEWKVINAYWLGEKRRSYTSSSFLIDKKGIIRFVHDGGEYFRSESDNVANAAYLALDEKIQQLLKE